MSADIVRCKQLLHRGNSFHSVQCNHPAIRDGFCGHHHPDRAEARKRGQQTVIDRKAAAVAREWEAIRERERKIAAFPALVAALESYVRDVADNGLPPTQLAAWESACAAIKLARGE